MASTSHRAAAVARLVDLALPGQVRIGVTTSGPVSWLPSGVAALDTLLGGGVPRGRISEVIGPPSSGRTSILLTLLATATRRGEVVAWVDLTDALHPESCMRAGVDLHRLLWVRPQQTADGLHCAEILLRAGGFALVALDCGAVPPGAWRMRVWPRLLQAAEQSHTALVVLAPQRIVGSPAALGLRLGTQRTFWLPGVWPLFEGFDTVANLERNKLGNVARARVRVRTASAIQLVPSTSHEHESP
jgi:hypothetical protein